MVTNQPDVARGTASRKSIHGINERLRTELDLDAVLTCFHDEADACICRKPKSGLLLRAAQDFAINLSSSYMVGDRWRDIEAGRRAGCKTFLIDHEYDEELPQHYDFRVGSLVEAAGIIMKQLDSE